MKLLFTLATIFNFASINSNLVTKKTDNIYHFETSSKLDEENLELTLFKKGEQPYKKPLITINKNIFNNDEQSLIIKFDYVAFMNLIDETAQDSGLLNGETIYETLGKDNLFIDVRYFIGLSLEAITKNGKEIKLSRWNTSDNQMLLEKSPQIILNPISSIANLRINFNPELEQINFGNKKEVIVYPKWQYINFGDKGNVFDLYRLFQKFEMTKDELEVYAIIHSEFLSKLRIALDDDHRVASNDFDIVYANQGSEKESVVYGYNVKVPLNLTNKTTSFSGSLLLLPILLIVMPFLYYSIQKIRRR